LNESFLSHCEASARSSSVGKPGHDRNQMDRFIGADLLEQLGY